MRKYTHIITKLFFILTFIVCAVQQVTAQTYIEYVDSADYYIKREMWQDAERVTVSAIKKMPANKLNYLLWTNLGEIRSRMGKFEDALEAFDIGLASKPHNVDLLNKRAAAYLQLNKDSLAREDINKSLRLDSIQRWPLRTRGLMLLEQKRFDEAEKDFNLLMKYFPLEPASYKGQAQIEAIKGNPDKAIELYGKAIEISNDEETWFYKITVEIESGKDEMAQEDIRTALKRFPRCGNIYLLRGLMHKIKYQNESAEIDRKLALEYGADPLTVDKILPRQKK